MEDSPSGLWRLVANQVGETLVSSTLTSSAAGWQSGRLQLYNKHITITTESGLASVGKGRLAEAKVVAELVAQGVEVYLPIFGNGLCDLIAICDGGLIRVETKYSAILQGGYVAHLRQIRANRSQMLVKHFSAANSDVLAVYVAPLDRVAFLPSALLDGRSAITLREEVLDDYREFRLAMTAVLPKYRSRGGRRRQHTEGTLPAEQLVPKTSGGQ